MPRRVLGRRAHRRAAGRGRPGPDRLPRQQQVGRPSCAAPLEAGVGRIIVDSFDEIDRLAALAAETGADGPGHGAGDRRASRRTPTSTSPPRTRTRSSASRSAPATPSRRSAGSRRPPGFRLLGLHSHIGSQIFDTSGFEVAARRVLALHARISDELGVDAARARPRRRLRHRLHHPGRPGRPGAARRRADQDRRARVPRARRSRCRGCRSSRAGRSSVRRCARSTRSAPSRRSSSTPAPSARYVSVDGGMSDNIRTALYDADYSATLASRRREAPPVLSRVVGKHCEAGDIVVKDEFLPGDVAPGDLVAVPGTGAYCRSMASNYNHLLRPPVVAVRDGVATVVVRRETEDDLLRTDVGAEQAGGTGRHGTRRGTVRASQGDAAEGRAARLRLGRQPGGPAAARAGRRPRPRGSAPRSSWSGVAVRRPDATARGRRPRRGCSPPTPRRWSPPGSTSSSR